MDGWFSNITSSLASAVSEVEQGLNKALDVPAASEPPAGAAAAATATAPPPNTSAVDDGFAALGGFLSASLASVASLKPNDAWDLAAFSPAAAGVGAVRTPDEPTPNLKPDARKADVVSPAREPAADVLVKADVSTGNATNHVKDDTGPDAAASDVAPVSVVTSVAAAPIVDADHDDALSLKRKADPSPPAPIEPVLNAPKDSQSKKVISTVTEATTAEPSLEKDTVPAIDDENIPPPAAAAAAPLSPEKRLASIISQREQQLLAAMTANAALSDEISDLKKQIDVLVSKDSASVLEEFTKRLDASEKANSLALKDRDKYKSNYNALQASFDDTIKQLSDREEKIKNLLEEGEKLSKNELKMSTIVKKLRAKEQESETLMKEQTKKIEQLTTELSDLKEKWSRLTESERRLGGGGRVLLLLFELWTLIYQF
ncbi:hypothetical protein BDR26DRAFT_698678 [Obelidium mucronatum]|nr:hypothetical protein BDR26DRAFT_698678 [Obelidium mucronatum]